MIERLVGVCAHKHLGGILLDVDGVGYGVETTPDVLTRLDVGSPAVLWVHTHVTQDALRLFGFPTLAERQVFTLLLSVSGLGPRIAMAMLAHLPAGRLAQAVEREDAAALEEVPGIGARQSKKFLLELKPKLAKLTAQGWTPAAALVSSETSEGRTGAVAADPPLAGALLADLQSALANFGYREKEVAPLLRRFERAPPARGLAELVRLALTELSAGARATDSDAEELF